MRRFAILVLLSLAGSGIAMAEESTSPYFGSSDQKPFQVAVDPSTSQPLVETIPAVAGVAIAK